MLSREAAEAVWPLVGAAFVVALLDGSIDHTPASRWLFLALWVAIALAVAFVVLVARPPSDEEAGSPPLLQDQRSLRESPEQEDQR